MYDTTVKKIYVDKLDKEILVNPRDTVRMRTIDMYYICNGLSDEGINRRLIDTVDYTDVHTYMIINDEIEDKNGISFLITVTLYADNKKSRQKTVNIIDLRTYLQFEEQLNIIIDTRMKP